MKLNWNTLLLILAAVAGLGPDLTAVSAWLQSSGIPHAVGIAHVFALGAAACAGLALAVPKLRGILAALGLATHPDNILPPIPADAPKSGGGKPPVAALLALFVGLGLLGYSVPARADALVLQLSPSWQCSPVGMLSGFQYNVRTGDFQRGVALGAGYGCRYTGWKVPLGIDAVGGVGVATNSPNAAQGSLIFTVADNYGIGPGTQIFKDPVDGSLHGQMLVSFFLTGSWAATVDQLVTAKHRAVEASQVKDGRVPWPY